MEWNTEGPIPDTPEEIAPYSFQIHGPTMNRCVDITLTGTPSPLLTLKGYQYLLAKSFG